MSRVSSDRNPERRSAGLAHLLVPWLAVCACGGSEAPESVLSLDGPREVRVEQLGVVEGPRVVLSEGAEGPVTWSVAPQSVAIVGRDGRVEAVAPGTAVVTGAWQQQQVQWTLIVEPPVTLRFLQPPASVGLGRDVLLRVEGRLGDQTVDAGVIDWSSSDEAVLTVADGTATGKALGVAYVTAESHSGSRATLQLQVVE